MFNRFKTQWRASIKNMKKRPWQFASIPVMAGIVGYVTNYVGVSMLFYPIEWTGVPFKRWPDQPLGLIGWQGIVPAKRVEMATTMVDVTLTRLLKISEVFEKLNPTSMAEILAAPIKEVIYAGMLPIPIVNYFLQAVSAEVIDKIESLVSIKDIVVLGMTRDPAMLGQFFQRVGSKELEFLVNSGTYFGFLLGLLQMVQWMIFPANWTLPLGGAVVGFVTNWIALKMVFEPVEPVQIGPFVMQGMFLKRQKEVSAEFSTYLANNVLTSREIWKSILTGEHSKDFEKIISRNVPFLTSSMIDAIMQSLHQLLLGDFDGAASHSDQAIAQDGTNAPVTDRPEQPHAATASSSALLPNGEVDDMSPQKDSTQHHPLHTYIDHALEMDATLVDRMLRLTPAEFERVLHPIFEEDELTLIAAGGVLGLMAGGMQWFINVALDKREAARLQIIQLEKSVYTVAVAAKETVVKAGSLTTETVTEVRQKVKTILPQTAAKVCSAVDTLSTKTAVKVGEKVGKILPQAIGILPAVKTSSSSRFVMLRPLLMFVPAIVRKR